MTGDRFEAGWEGLWLVIEEIGHGFQAFVYDPPKTEVVHSVSRLRLDYAKLAVVEHAISMRFGLQSDLKPQVIADMLDWKKMT
jgi:hypothetical protein